MAPRHPLLLLLLLLLVAGARGASLVSRANRFRARAPVALERIAFGRDATTDGWNATMDARCHAAVRLVWRAVLHGRVSPAAPPVCFDLDADGSPEAIATTEEGALEVLAAGNAAPLPGFPLLLDAPVSAAPVPLVLPATSLAARSEPAILVATRDAQLHFFDRRGRPAAGFPVGLRVPPLRVPLDWHLGAPAERGVVFALSLHRQQPVPPAELAAAWAALHQQAPLPSPPSNASLAGFEGWLPPEGVASLQELFLTPGRRRRRGGGGARAVALDAARRDIFVDAHVLHAPVVADLESDGGLDVVVPVSYFFDDPESFDAAALHGLPASVALDAYAGAGVAVFELPSGRLKWVSNFDVTTAHARASGHQFSSPTVADVDGDGRSELYVTTGVGQVFRVDHAGRLLVGPGSAFPLSLDALFAPAVLGDVTGDGAAELVLADANANVLCVSATTGAEVWDVRVSGVPLEAPALGDVDGDGALDVVLATTEGHVWALRGADGTSLPHFPVKLGGRLEAEPLLVALARTKIVVLAADGHVYFVDGATGCADRVDLGDSSGGAGVVVRAGGAALLAASHGGVLHLLAAAGTPEAAEAEEEVLDVVGRSFPFRFAVAERGQWHLTARVGGVPLLARAGVGAAVVATELRVEAGGSFRDLLRVEVRDAFGVVRAAAALPLRVNVHAARAAKWLLVLPLGGLLLTLLFYQEVHGGGLLGRT